jgi:hypothetical protein
MCNMQMSMYFTYICSILYQVARRVMPYRPRELSTSILLVHYTMNGLPNRPRRTSTRASTGGLQVPTQSLAKSYILIVIAFVFVPVLDLVLVLSASASASTSTSASISISISTSASTTLRGKLHAPRWAIYCLFVSCNEQRDV